MKKITLYCIFISLCSLSLNVKAQDDCSVDGLTVDVKTSSTGIYKAYPTRTICQLPEFYENSPTISTNIYGSRTDKQTVATGFYYTKQINDRWWVVDPLGYLSICRAVNSISQGSGTTSKSTFATKFGNSNTTWMNSTKQLLNDNGFFCAGAWSTIASITSNPDQSTKPLAYTILLNWMRGYGSNRTYKQPGHAGYPNDAIFVFESGFPAYCETNAQELANNKFDKNLFGYFTDNELPFYNQSLNNFLKLGQTSPTDENYLATKKWLSDNGYTEADTTNVDIQKQFLGFVAHTYFSIVYNAIKKYDPNHMVLGPRVNVSEARENPYFMQAAGSYVDILAVNYYGVWTPNIARNINWGINLGKPFMVTEFYTKGVDSGLPNTTGAGWIVKTQLERGYEYQNFTLALLESKYCVGWHWFKYMDNDPSIVEAEASNIDSNKGIVNIAYEPYSPLMDKMKELNLKVYNLIDYFDNQKPLSIIYPEADAYFKGAENHGIDDRLGIKYTTSENYFRESFIRFNLSGLNDNVNKVNLKLFALKGGDSEITYKADFVADDNWTESSITMAQHPVGTYEIGRWSHSSDVTLDVKQSFLESVAADYKLSIKLSALNEAVSQLEYASRENPDISLRPHLEITEAEPLNAAYLSDLFIQDKRYSSFNPDTLVYNIVLPPETNVNPKIQYDVPNIAMSVVLTNPVNILSSTAADRTAIITTTSGDGLMQRTYKLIFKVSSDVSTIVENKYNSDFTVYPNPVGANKSIILDISNSIGVNNQVSITDLSGKNVFKNDFMDSKYVLSIVGLLPGIYLISVKSFLGLVTSKLIVY